MTEYTFPLNHLLKKDSLWAWSSNARAAFERLKQSFWQHHVMRVRRGWVHVYHVMEDGKERPITYASKCLTPAERNYTQIERECVSIVLGTQKFRLYLLGHKFQLRTDHRPLVSLFDVTKVTTPTCSSSRLVRWALQLSQFDYEIVLSSSASRGNAGCLSPLPVSSDDEFDEFSRSEEEH